MQCAATGARRWCGGPNNKVASAEECCAQCRAYKPAGDEDMDCNVWVWCGDRERCLGSFQECWLKHLVGGR